MDKIFVDTAAFLALINKSDRFHQNAKSVRDKLSKEKVLFVTTDQVIIEVANSLSKLKFRNAVVQLIDSIINSTDIEIVWTDKDIFDKAFDFYKKVIDKEWGLTDCISFVVMKDKNIKNAFTTDFHFEQAGFVKLL